jgi:hypothetical protein
MKSTKRIAIAALFLATGLLASGRATARDGSAVVYCTAKVNSLGCTPEIAFAGTPSASSTSGFTVSATSIHNDRRGLLFYGLSGPMAAPFLGGTLCVKPRVYRTPQQNSLGGIPKEADCSGTFSIDMNAFAAGLLGGHPRPELGMPGTTVHCQYWNREEAATFSAGLTDAVEYTVGV